MTLKEIKNNILNEFKNTKFAKNGGGCFECCEYENMYHELENFIFQKIGEAVKESFKEIEKRIDDTVVYGLEEKKIEGLNESINEIIIDFLKE